MVTLATFYTPRPSACWDGPERTAVPPVAEWTAHPSLHCGTLVQVTGPLGSITVPVYDHGPNGWAAALGRGLDMSPAAFAEVAPLTAGVVPVRYRVVSP